MKSSKEQFISFFTSVYEGKARKKNQELELAFVDIDERLKQLGNSQDLSQVRRLIPDIRSDIYWLYSLAVHGLDLRAFASHEPGDKTPLNSTEC